MTARLPLSERMSVETSWDQLRARLERHQRQRHLFPQMDITKFPEQSPAELPPLMDSLIEPLDEAVIVGNLADEVLEEGSVEEIAAGVDVVVYTRCVKLQNNN